MKIAFTTFSNRLIGGAETYIEAVASFLGEAGHQTALWHEIGGPPDRHQFSEKIFHERHCLTDLRLAEWIRTLTHWQPDVIFGHGVSDPDTEAETLKIAPSVFFIHNYDGTCISGAKSHAYPKIEPCSRKFGPSCLLAFYPKRCGGLNPLTLIEDYRKTVDRLKLMKAYSRVVTHTLHMAEEYRTNGVPCRAISGFSRTNQVKLLRKAQPADETWNLLFIGRMVNLKGGGVLLDALPTVARSLRKPLKVKFLGDGPARDKWERQAALVERNNPSVKIEFPGWLTEESFEDAVADAHLHVLPSLWPEPFGMSGLELGLIGIPTAAFSVGGIPDWIDNNVNGTLADYSEPLAENLSNAIIRALGDKDVYSDLQRGAQRVASSMTLEKHCAQLMDVFNEINLTNAGASLHAVMGEMLS